MEKFAIGLAIGAIVGAVIIANSQKTRQLVVKGQEEIKSKLDNAIDQKLQDLEEDDYDDDDEEMDYPKEQSKPKANRLRKSR